MNTQLAHEVAINEEEDAAPASRIKIDYEKIFAEMDPDNPRGDVAFSDGDYETEEEADAAFEAFIDSIVNAPYEEE